MRLVLLTGMMPVDPVRWARVSPRRPDGTREVEQGTADGVADLGDLFGGAGDDITVVLPGEPFAARRLDNPARNMRQLRQAARFLLEDELAGPVDDMHIALGEAGTTGKGDGIASHPVIAAPREWIADWLEALREAGLTPTTMTADFLAIGIDGAGVMLVTEDRLTCNLDGDGFAAERPMADELAGMLVEQSGLKRIGVIRVGAAAMPQMPEGHSAEQAKLREAQDLPAFIAGQTENRALPNLLQGDFAPAIDWRGAMRPWRWVGSLAAASLVLGLIVVAVEGFAMHRAADRLTAAAEAEFSAAYPDLPTRNIRAQARTLAGAGASGGTAFLELSSILAQALENRDGVQLSAVAFDPEQQLVADIRFTDTVMLEELKTALADYGITVQEGRNLSRDADDAYIGKLYLRSS